MNKLKQIEALVASAMAEFESNLRRTAKEILTDLAKKSAEIDREDWEKSAHIWIGDTINNYNSRLLGDEKKEVKQEQPALQPLPEQMPEWFASYFNGRGNDAVSCYIHCKYTFGTPPRAWWMDLKKGDKFMCGDGVRTFSGKYSCIDGNYFLYTIEEGDIGLHFGYCSPYTDPEAELRKTLNPEQIKLLDEMKANTKANTKV